MRQIDTRLKKVPVDLDSVALDHPRFAEIVTDLRANGGQLVPHPPYITDDEIMGSSGNPTGLVCEESLSSAIVSMSPLSKVLNLLIGTKDQPATLVMDRYRPWMEAYDPLNLWRMNVTEANDLSTLTIADLQTMLELTLLYSFITSTEGPTTVLELGGGYGRLAEPAMNIFSDVKWVLIDVVPTSLFYAKEYLKRACPQKKIASFYDGTPFNLDDFDCYIVPAWHFERLSSVIYDGCICIECFTVMSQAQVDYYLRLLDHACHPDSIVYISNSHDPLEFRDGLYIPAKRSRSRSDALPETKSWTYPKSWQRLFCSNTPTSGTADHPTEIFVKGLDDRRASRVNGSILACHVWDVANRRRAAARASAWHEAGHLGRRILAGIGRRVAAILRC